ncbi:hypothetical protein EX30DRAFT_343598 [Ascodesmis nigricans]|uniref:Uncharacterized protein n=1 Tax=Ascodesmis nigricans TaxID=341454 RepID=A0A4S2MRX5_9PEZI|nr:hypothetical protein EX30DRAFT_343598 [Ascodesmis nigricans]
MNPKPSAGATIKLIHYKRNPKKPKTRHNIRKEENPKLLLHPTQPLPRIPLHPHTRAHYGWRNP